MNFCIFFFKKYRGKFEDNKLQRVNLTIFLNIFFLINCLYLEQIKNKIGYFINLKLAVIILQLVSEFIIIISKNYSKTYIIQYFITFHFFS